MIYSLYANLTYLAFGNSIKESIIEQFPDDKIMVFTRFLFIIAALATYNHLFEPIEIII
jgi:hypothetical protein